MALIPLGEGGGVGINTTASAPCCGHIDKVGRQQRLALGQMVTICAPPVPLVSTSESRHWWFLVEDRPPGRPA